MKVLCVLFISLLGLCLAQNAPPLLTGTWTSECSLIQNSPNLYQIRTTTYGAWDNELQEGTWTSVLDAYSSNICDPNFQQYRLTYTGSYQLTGKQSDIPLFWNINYRYNSKTLEVFSDDFAAYIDNDPSCGITNIVSFSVMSVRHSHCENLQIVPIEDCPISYDIIRRFGDILWMGNQFEGDPIYWNAHCQEEDRLQVPDDYYFVISTAVNDYDYGVDLDYYLYTYEDDEDDDESTFITTEFETDEDDLGIDSYTVYGASSSGNILAVSMALLFVIVALF